MARHGRIKYCGGCNPAYDRRAIAELIAARLSGAVEWAGSDGEAFDFVVAVNGCETACAELKAFQGKEVYVITRPEDAQSLIDALKPKG